MTRRTVVSLFVVFAIGLTVPSPGVAGGYTRAEVEEMVAQKQAEFRRDLAVTLRGLHAREAQLRRQAARLQSETKKIMVDMAKLQARGYRGYSLKEAGIPSEAAAGLGLVGVSVVFDPPHFVERLIEIGQKAVQIWNQIQQIVKAVLQIRNQIEMLQTFWTNLVAFDVEALAAMGFELDLRVAKANGEVVQVLDLRRGAYPNQMVFPDASADTRWDQFFPGWAAWSGDGEHVDWKVSARGHGRTVLQTARSLFVGMQELEGSMEEFAQAVDAVREQSLDSEGNLDATQAAVAMSQLSAESQARAETLAALGLNLQAVIAAAEASERTAAARAFAQTMEGMDLETVEVHPWVGGLNPWLDLSAGPLEGDVVRRYPVQPIE